ncbi:inorganic phosphate transporter [Parasphaerochaeta coccoides]|uniref:Phosphate transporter n=1 Tax=Parasphaerochaeta coccoides (strain ATCC BAA-1237 / DSM 17374 / SPN1) TaxID=760011 RepID=F4GJX7_PARC1|nr:inorganic phosphate transporter [Parasphaerochaeta coccoides]AEC01402.1 phosphate transporter [Parasphaerochaeta coccoides DSM 17374]
MSFAFIASIVLVLSVIFVNGWTDAPNAIGSAVGTRAMSPNSAIFMAFVFNFLGVLLMTSISTEVADTISKMVDFSPRGELANVGDSTQNAIIVLAAAMFAIVVWATGAWWFGIPTSESHSLIAGLTGAALALGGVSAINMAEWSKVLIGLVASTVLGFGLGWFLVRFIEKMACRYSRARSDGFFRRAQIAAAAFMAFLHGAQDGQKFMSVFMLALFLNGNAMKAADGTFNIPLWVMLVCSSIMGIGTLVGGKKIIKTVGLDMVKMRPYQGFASDASAGVSLLLSTLTGLPVSTTHTKTTAVMGVAASRRVSSVDWNIAKDMVAAWLLTFPGCGLLGFLMAKLFLYIF